MNETQKDFKICRQCILPSNFEGIKFNSSGVCEFCEKQNYTGKLKTVNNEKKSKLANELDEILINARNKGEYYDVAIGFSGGKDSAYLAYKLNEKYNLRVLAIVIDHSYFPPVVENNVTKVAKSLELDILYYRLPKGFINNFFLYKFENYKQLTGSIYDRICFDCSDIIEGNVMKLSAQMKIPVVLIGLSPEQTNRYFYKIPDECIKNHMIRPFYQNDHYFSVSDQKNLWNPKNEFEKNLKVFFPYHVWDYNVEEVVKTLSEKGLLKKEESDPFNTECRIMQVMRYVYKKKRGYDPRIGPFSDLVRFGKATRTEMIEKFYNQNDNSDAVDYVQNRLKMNIDIDLSSIDEEN